MQVRPERQWIRIFLASPGDTAGARAQVVGAVERIASDPAYRNRFEFQLCRWDDPDKPVAVSWRRNPQHEVVTYTGNPADCDLLICLLRHKFGSPLPEADFGLNDKGERWTGTEWELAQAQREQWVWRDVTPFQLEAGLLADEQNARFQQFQAVESFFSDATDDSGSIARGYDRYESHADLSKKIDKRLREWLNKQFGTEGLMAKAVIPETTLSTSQQHLLTQLLELGECEDQELLAAAREAKPSCVQSYLLGRYAWWAERCKDLKRPDFSHFVNLQLHVDRGPQAEDKRFETSESYKDLAELLQAEESKRGIMLVGDPGCGKSTLLQHYEMTQAVRSLRAIEAGDNNPELCIWLRLSQLQPEDVLNWDADVWLTTIWAEHWPMMPNLRELGRDYRLRYVLDGLNEVKVPSKVDYRLIIARWTEWLEKAQGIAAPLFSVRTLNYSRVLTGSARVDIKPWEEEQRRTYVMQRLPASKGRKLLTAIDEQGMGDFNSLPINLSHQCELFEELGRPAEDRAELMSGLVWLRLRDDRLPPDSELLGDDDWDQVADRDFWRDHLLNLPVQGPLISALDAEALAMHRDAGGTEIAKAVEEVAKTLNPFELRQQWLAAVYALQLARKELGGNFRFVHQSWQEFFAARGLKADDVPDMAPLALTQMDEVLTSLGIGDLLPGPDVSSWEESAKLALQLAATDKRPALLNALHASNLPLAARAAIAIKQQLEEAETDLDPLRHALLARSRDTAVDLRLRIEAGELLGELGDPRYVEHTSAEHVRYRLPSEEHWIRFAAGDYTVGSEDGDDDEKPPISVPLGAFAAAFVPVTNAEYRLFIDAKGYEDERWWPEGAARQWQRGEWAQDDRIEWFEERFAALRDDFDAAVAKYYTREPKSFVETELRKYAAWGEQEASEVLQSSFGAKKHRLPNEWGNLLFNKSAQPVVGVCVFEAEAYCRWLAHHSGRTLRLPSEAQWEGAARGLSARPWPFVGQPFAQRFNYDPTHLRRTVPVGVFPESDSPEGLFDMAGNVWEWTCTDFQSKLTEAGVITPASAEGAVRSLRGGAWYNGIGNCRPSFRNSNNPGYRDDYCGFRVFWCPIQSPEP